MATESAGDVVRETKASKKRGSSIVEPARTQPPPTAKDKPKSGARGKKGSVISGSAPPPPPSTAGTPDDGKEKDAAAGVKEKPMNRRRSLMMIFARRDSIRDGGGNDAPMGGAAAAMEVVDLHHGNSNSGVNDKRELSKSDSDKRAKKTSSGKEGEKEKEVEKEREKEEKKPKVNKQDEKQRAQHAPSVGESHLLGWCRKQTATYKGVEIDDFQASWRDGLAFCALVHRFKPNAFDYDQLRPDDADANLKLAFTTAERELGVPSYLSSEAVADSDGVDVLTYLLKFHSLVEDKDTQEGTDLGSNPSCVILAEASLNSSGGAQPAQVLATLASSRPRLATPKRAAAAAGRRPPTRGVRPGDKISVKAVVENRKVEQDNTVFCMEGDANQQGTSPRKRSSTVAGATPPKTLPASGTRPRKGTAPPPLEKTPTMLNRAAATTEGDVEIPAWKQRLIEKKRIKAAEGQDGENGTGLQHSDGTAQQGCLNKSSSSADADSECHLMEGFLFKRDGERWLRKWFVLSGPYLVCYGDKRTEKNQLSPQGILSLELASTVAASPDKANGIDITDQTDGKYQVYACTKGEHELWLDSITAAQAKYSHRYLNRPVSGSGSARWFNIASAAKEGELLLLPGKGLGSIIGARKWKKTYVIVKDGFLERRQAKGDKTKLRVPLIKCEFTVYEDRTQKHAFKVSTSKKKLVLAAADDDDMHSWMDSLLKQRHYLEQAINSVAAAVSDSSSAPTTTTDGESNRGRKKTNESVTTASSSGKEEAGGLASPNGDETDDSQPAAKDKGKEKSKA